MDTIKILLVDDEADFRDIMAAFFTRRKMACHTASCCLEALDLLGREQFDVVVMDVVMPGMDGLACMKEMHRVIPELPVIILTGNASLNTGIMSMKQGAFDFCLKPVDMQELFEKVLLAGEKRRAA